MGNYTGSIKLPLHGGKAPYWLFHRMREMAGIISEWIIDEYGPETFTQRMADPLWFQGFALVLGFDWHSSGTTTTALAALREGYKGDAIKILGGKGKASRESFSGKYERDERLAHSMFSKALVDGYNLYFAASIESERSFVVIDQGLNKESKYARRYHWHSKFGVYKEAERILGVEDIAINTISKNADSMRKAILDIVKEGRINKEVVEASEKLKKIKEPGKKQHTLVEFNGEIEKTLPRRHWISRSDLSKRDLKIFEELKEYQPKSYEELLLFKGVGEKKIRALSLIANLIYGEKIDWKDPVKYSYAHGGKDGIPYPVDRRLYDSNIQLLREALEESKQGKGEIKKKALKKLNVYIQNIEKITNKKTKDI